MTIHLPGSLEEKIRLYFFDQLTSQTPGHRKSLRQQLVEKLKENSLSFEPDALLDLSTPPQVPSIGVSLSHSPLGSLIAINLAGNPIGVDIESRQRITPEVINRIRCNDEGKSLSDQKMMFPAKEAAWKALNKSYPSLVISQIETAQWSKIDSTWFSYSVSIGDDSPLGKGYVLSERDFYIALFT